MGGGMGGNGYAYDSFAGQGYAPSSYNQASSTKYNGATSSGYNLETVNYGKHPGYGGTGDLRSYGYTGMPPMGAPVKA